MTYGDITETIYSLNTGNIPDRVDFLTKLVCGKIARKRLNSLIRLAEITVNGSTVGILRDTIPDFFDFKISADNSRNAIYSLDSNGNTIFYPLLSSTDFAQETSAPCAKREGSILTLNFGNGYEAPTKIYFPYYSFYCWQDADTGVAMETPVNSDDICILPSLFDDVIIDGLLLYISRKEKESKEYEKNVIEWEKRLNDIIFLS